MLIMTIISEKFVATHSSFVCVQHRGGPSNSSEVFSYDIESTAYRTSDVNGFLTTQMFNKEA